MLQKLLTNLLLLLLSFVAFAQSNIDSTFEQLQSTDYPIIERSFDEGKLNTYQNDPAFQYDKEFIPPSDGLFERMWYWFLHQLDNLFRVDGVSNLWDLFKYAAFILLIAYALSRLFGMSMTNLFIKRDDAQKIDYKLVDEDIHEMDFNVLIQEAVQERNYRKAIRLYYLKSLKALTDKEIIEWKKNKTNSDYCEEIKNPRLGTNFAELSHLFDYVWYGEFDLNDQTFRETESKFQQFIQAL